MTKDEALWMSLNEIGRLVETGKYTGATIQTMQAIKEALAQPEQNLKGWLIEYEMRAGGTNRGSSLKKFDYVWYKCSFVSEDKDAELDAITWRNRKETPLYTTPPQRKPLTREQVLKIWKESGYDEALMEERAHFINGIRHAEVAHGIKDET